MDSTCMVAVPEGSTNGETHVCECKQQFSQPLPSEQQQRDELDRDLHMSERPHYANGQAP